jgi:integrase
MVPRRGLEHSRECLILQSIKQLQSLLVTEMITEKSDMAKLPKYTRELKGSLFYQRDIPTRLKHLSPKKTFTFPLSLKVLEASESALAKAHSEATQAFELHCKMLETSNPEAFNTDDLERAAYEVLRKANRTAGQYTYSAIEGFDGVDLADDTIWVDEIRGKQKAGEPLTFKEKAELLAWEKLWNAKASKPQTMANFWVDYAAHKNLTKGTRETKRREKRWLRWLATIGNHKIAQSTLDIIHHALDDYVEERLQEVAPSSVKREMNDILAILRHANQKHRYGWVIQKPAIPYRKPKPKIVLNHEEQRLVVNHCLSNANSPVAACVLLQLQGAMMPSEVERLTDKDIALNVDVPHIVISGDTKTSSRKRIIPIVIGLEFIRANLPTTLEWLKRTTESAHSRAIQKLLRTATGNEKLTGHGLRHTFKANCMANGADTNSTAAIAGWSGSSLGISSEMLAYGAEGLANSDVLKGLQRESLKIHKHLLKDDNKVVQLRTA